MKKNLLLKALIRYILGFVLVCMLLFIPAGTIKYFNAWLFIGLLFIPMFIVGIILFIKSPKLLESRLDVREKEKDQKEVVLYSGLMFIIGFVIAGLNYRFSWTTIPNIIVLIASVLFVISYVLYAEVLRENAFLSRTIKTLKNQKLVDTGFYKIVRHPMYSITLVLFLTMPLILGSIISFVIFLIYPFIICKRIINEEKILERELKGYKDYKKKVKYRLIPFVW